MFLLAPAASGTAGGGRHQPARIVEGAGDRPAFDRAGVRLSLQVTETATVEVALPRPARVVTTVRDGDRVWVGGHTGADGDLFLAAVTRDGALTPLPEPGDRRRARTFPALIADRHRATGVVWQEGDRQEDNSIRAAAWLGEAWGPVEVVSPARGRAQTGLTATVLDDGSWLAVWAAVDEEDDLWWSRRTEDGWSAPRRVHPDNDTPDILPSLVATRDGALVAWTAYDGADYRLRLAALDGERWVERSIRGGRGAEPARWLVRDNALGLLYSSVEPDVWGVVWLDDGGRETGRLAAAQVRAEEPMVVERGAELVLRWPPVAPGDAALEVPMTAAEEPGR